MTNNDKLWILFEVFTFSLNYCAWGKWAVPITALFLFLVGAFLH